MSVVAVVVVVVVLVVVAAAVARFITTKGLLGGKAPCSPSGRRCRPRATDRGTAPLLSLDEIEKPLRGEIRDMCF